MSGPLFNSSESRRILVTLLWALPLAAPGVLAGTVPPGLRLSPETKSPVFRS